jgi:hypothetical protein
VENLVEKSCVSAENSTDFVKKRVSDGFLRKIFHKGLWKTTAFAV